MLPFRRALAVARPSPTRTRTLRASSCKTFSPTTRRAQSTAAEQKTSNDTTPPGQATSNGTADGETTLAATAQTNAGETSETPSATDTADSLSQQMSSLLEEQKEATSSEESSDPPKKWTFAELAAERKSLQAAMNAEKRAASAAAPAATAAKGASSTTPKAPAAKASPKTGSSPAASTPASASEKTRTRVSSAPAAAPTSEKPKSKADQTRPQSNTNPKSMNPLLPPLKSLVNKWDVWDKNQLDGIGGVADVDWRTSFRGVSAKPVVSFTAQALLAPIEDEDVEVKPDGIIYLPEIKYRRKLNEAFGPMGWGLIPRGDPVVGDSIVTREYCLVADGRFVAQAQGENQYFGTDQLPSAVEGCKSNALMRCCKDLGIASELWDPAYIRWFRQHHMESRWVENVNTKKKRQFWFKKGNVDVVFPWKLSKA